jgi:hypothetical protein
MASQAALLALAFMLAAFTGVALLALLVVYLLY